MNCFTEALLDAYRGLLCLLGRHTPGAKHPDTTVSSCRHCRTFLLRRNGVWKEL